MRRSSTPLPVNGGTPRRVTAKGPSYLHGWSPDGKYLVYTGERDDEFDIYKISVRGGEETNLTNTKGLDDGPEFTPDGTIYLLQLNALGNDANLAHEAGRQRSGTSYK